MFYSACQLLQELIGERDNEVGTTSKGKIDKTGTFYHVTSHSFNDEKIYGFNSALYRENLLFSACKRHNVQLIFSTVQPTHSHDVFMCNKIEDIMGVMRETNHKVSHYLMTNNPKHYSIPGIKVFQERPAYQKVSTFQHLLFLAKYLYDNGENLRKQGKKVPYCCFDELERGFFNNYPKELYPALFQIEISEIIKNCKEMSKDEFRQFCTEKYIDIDKSIEEEFFSSKR